VLPEPLNDEHDIANGFDVRSRRTKPKALGVIPSHSRSRHLKDLRRRSHVAGFSAFRHD
jgi:hypothetical protein